MSFSIDQFRIDDKVAIVTGAGGRGNSIGRAYALGLAGAGAAVVVADINGDGAQAVADEILASGGKAIAVTVDITDKASADAMVASAVAAFGGVDILVNNAALMAELGALAAADIALDEWNRIMNVNVTGSLLCAQAVIPELRKRGGGRIINQVSGGAFPAASIYGVSKLALLGLTTTLAKQLGREGIAVNAIAPGNVTSDAGKLLTPDESPFIKFLEMNVAMRVRGTPDELVGTLLLLCSQAGAWITGQVFHVDGGWVIRP
ncbi:SDR family oxidoreductase [Sphingobium boeckii]|uniref:NAD(P)-dependent dehydrogenase (Short-subunit alcohol dehydrogenase family) n=1 Tax=Sphingobium boeckii TaxID=1082345 RepID=A0A7W9AHS6_9SPHN|nr:SDR family oxidoreductase [Sphingobium boeckii]MBB5685943.1 NAD(P)-dependent dehydrogenase (short-subunit alcohol dehydrogenase family) [Sphingobium boeckii]